ncbi:hypothetical protein [Leptospira bouyouniensis]|uniref:Uncharacterized protein n=1 Tax=Leptospira bouyouniensis TaxID=2484911 RepID=A0ABY2L993_9LEPT|nr:hypothetical protein [Leptospira bouyouniensis]TGK53221.1 hypothetical protein EHQ10_05630 [Leptospira bouyouniensis]
MIDYLKLATQFRDKGVRSDSNMPLFEAALKNAQGQGEAPLTSWDAVRILQAIVWLEWCYIYNFKTTLQVPVLINDESFQKEMKSLGLSMTETIRENLNNETKEPKPNIAPNLVSSDVAQPQGESNQGTVGTDAKPLETNETQGEANGSTQSG